MKTVAVLGASNKEGRYSRMAQEILMKKGYEVFPISVKSGDILGLKSYKSINEVPQKIDTLTVYVSPKNLEKYVDEIIRSDIRRVIFNPGTESDSIKKQFQKSGKVVVEACSIVMLKTEQFDKS
jgi:predicted CoA-binding protein